MANADMFMDVKIKEMDGIVRILNGRIHALQGNIDHIKDSLNKKDDAGILEYFALEFPKLAQSTDSDLPQLKEISEQAQLKCKIKTDSLNKFIEIIQAMQVEVNNFDGEIHDQTDIRDVYQSSLQAQNQDERGRGSVLYHAYSKGSQL